MELTTHLKRITKMVVCFLMTGTLSAQTLHETTIINDKSMGNPCQFDSKPLLVDLIKKSNLKNDQNVGVVLRTSTCGIGRIPNVKTTVLPAVKSSFFGSSGSVTDRRKKLGRFLTEAKVNLDSLSSGPCDQTQTNLYRTVSYISHLYDSTATSKTLILITDLAENSSVFQSSIYINKPGALLKDYDRIVATFQKDAPLPDLSGVTVEIISPMDSDFSLYLGRFWTRLFISCGAKSVQVRTAF